MFQPSSSFDYEKEFPPFEEYFDSQGQRHVPKVQNPTTIEANGTK